MNDDYLRNVQDSVVWAKVTHIVQTVPNKDLPHGQEVGIIFGIIDAFQQQRFLGLEFPSVDDCAMLIAFVEHYVHEMGYSYSLSAAVDQWRMEVKKGHT